jgi:hypothetical protein
MNKRSGLFLPDDRTITISVIAGSSNGLTHQLTKARTSIGRAGGSADIEIDDPQVSPLHCVVGVTHDMVRLCDLTPQTVRMQTRNEFRPPNLNICLSSVSAPPGWWSPSFRNTSRTQRVSDRTCFSPYRELCHSDASSFPYWGAGPPAFNLIWQFPGPNDLPAVIEIRFPVASL